MVRQVILTQDGSHTIQVSPSVTYHSRHGAVQESQHVFIQNGLEAFYRASGQSSIRVCEVGWGTGLNALLSLDYGLRHNLRLYYTGIEAYPLESELYTQLNYDVLGSVSPEAAALFAHLHDCEWGQSVEICAGFRLCKYAERIEWCQRVDRYDVVYFDAFAPNDQAEVWTEAVFKHLYELLNVGGVLVTYCAKGVIRRRLEDIGYVVEKMPGPPGKREMLRAWKR